MAFPLSLRLRSNYLLPFLFAVLPISLSATTFTALTSGQWSSDVTWGGTAPGALITAGDQIIIGPGVTVTLDVDVEFNEASASLILTGELYGPGSSLTILAGALSGDGNLTLRRLTLGIAALVTATGKMEVEVLATAATAFVSTARISVSDSLKCTGGVCTLAAVSSLHLSSNMVLEMSGGSLISATDSVFADGPLRLVYTGGALACSDETRLAPVSSLLLNLPDPDQPLALSADLQLSDSLVLLQGRLDLAGYNLTLAGMLSQTTKGTLYGHPQSGLILNTGQEVSLLFYPGSGHLDSLTLQTTVGNVTMLSDLRVDSLLWLSNGSLLLNGRNLDLHGTAIFGSSTFLYALAGSGLYLNGVGSLDLPLPAAGATLDTLIVNQAGGDVRLKNNLVVSGYIGIQQGSLDLNGKDLTIDGSIATASGAFLAGNVASDLLLEGSGDDTLVFRPNAAKLASLAVNKPGGARTFLQTHLAVNLLNIAAGYLGLLDVDLSVLMNASSAANGAGIIGTPQSGLVLDGSGAASLAFAPSGAVLKKLVLSQQNGSLKMLSSLEVKELIDLQQGTLILNGNTLTLGGKLQSAPGSWLSGNASSGLVLDGTENITLVFSPGGTLLDTLWVSQAGKKVTMATNLSVFDFLNLEEGVLDLNGHDLTLRGTAQTTPGASLAGGANCGLYLYGTGDTPLHFSPGTAVLNALSVSQTSGSAVLYSDLSVMGSVELQLGALQLNGYNLKVSGTMTSSPGALIAGHSDSGLWLDGSGNTSVAFKADMAMLDTFLVSQTNGNVTLNSDLTVLKSLQLQQGFLSLNNHKLAIEGALTNSAGASLKGSASAELVVNSSSNLVLVFQANSAVLGKFTVSQSNNGGVAINSDLTVNAHLTLEEGTLVLNGYNLILNGGMSFQPGATFTGNSASGLIFNGTGDVFMPFAPNSALLKQLTVNLTGGGAYLQSNLTVGGTLQVQKGSLVLNNYNLASLGVYAGLPGGNIYGTVNSGLTLDGNGDAFLYFATGGDVLGNFTVSQSSGAVRLFSSLRINTTTTVQQGILALNGQRLLINGWLNISQGAALQGDPAARLLLDGTGPVALALTANGNQFDSLLVSQSNGNVTLQNDLVVFTLLQLDQGALVLDGHNLYLEGELQTAPIASLTGSLFSGLFLSGDGDVSLVFSQNGNSLDSLVINRNNGDVYLNNHLTIAASLQLLKGRLVLGNNNLILPIFSNLSGGSPESYVVADASGYLSGYVGAGSSDVLFPLGTFDGYFPATLHQRNGASDVQIQSHITAAVWSQGTTGIDWSASKKLIKNTWFFQPEDPDAQLDLRVTLGWQADFEVNGFDHNYCLIRHYSAQGWDSSPANPALTDPAGYFTITRDHISDLGPLSVWDGIILNATAPATAAMKVFPNPVSTGTPVYVRADEPTEGDWQISVWNTAGERMPTPNGLDKIDAQTWMFTTGDWPAGIYWVEMETGNGRILRSSLVKI